MKISLDQVIEALEFTSDMLEYYYNPKTKEIFLSNIGDIEDLTQEELDDLFESSIRLPSKYEINEYQMMVDFVYTFKDDRIRNKLLASINGRGAFRRFKNLCTNLDIIDDWYKFRDTCYKEIALKWCNEHDILIN